MNSPLTTYLEGRQILSLQHPQYGTLREMQQLSGFLERQEPQRLSVVFHSRCQSSNGNAIALLRVATRFLGKTGPLLSGPNTKICQ